MFKKNLEREERGERGEGRRERREGREGRERRESRTKKNIFLRGGSNPRPHRFLGRHGSGLHFNFISIFHCHYIW